MRKALILLFALSILCVVLQPSFHAEADDAGFLIVIASDLHYIAPELTDGGAYYQRVLKNGDSKFMPYIEEITEAFLDEVLVLYPDAVLLTGDLTFNGAEISHAALCKKLHRIEEAEIPVLVLTGNHDVYNINASRYFADSFGRVPFATTESFAALYADFGLSEALSVDADSLSYTYALSDSTRILSLDFNTAHDFCGISEETLHWVERQLYEAAEAGCTVLAAGHQNLFQHTVFREGYVVDGADHLAALLRKYKVPLFLSGHLHVQHRIEANNLTEITSSALSSYPCQYGVLSVQDGRLHYETRRLDMASWATKTARTEPVFQDFSEAAGIYMDQHFTPNDMEPLTDDPQLWAEMLRYLQNMNRAYFSGDLRDLTAADPQGRFAALWERDGGLTAWYLRSILTEAGEDYTVWDSD